MAEPLKTIGHMIASGMDVTELPEDLVKATPLNRVDLRTRYYAVMPRNVRRQVFGRWRRRSRPYDRVSFLRKVA